MPIQPRFVASVLAILIVFLPTAGGISPDVDYLDYVQLPAGTPEGLYSFCLMEAGDVCALSGSGNMQMALSYSSFWGYNYCIAQGWRSGAIEFAGTFTGLDGDAAEVLGTGSWDMRAPNPDAGFQVTGGSVAFTVNGVPFVGTWSISGRSVSPTSEDTLESGAIAETGDLQFTLDGSGDGGIDSFSRFQFSGARSETVGLKYHASNDQPYCDETRG